MSTCNWLDLQTLGSQPVSPKISPITGPINIILMVDLVPSFKLETMMGENRQLLTGAPVEFET